MKYAAIGPISVHFPERFETAEDLDQLFPQWNMPAIKKKTGIDKRYIAAPNECSSDLAVAAAEKLFDKNNIDRQSIDYILFCTQTPDYPLPTTSCLIQDRLKLRTNVGAIDFNQGCSGYVYGLSLADGLIRTGEVSRILFLTAETYTKFIHETDRSLRPIFSDAATATLIEAHDEPSLHTFEFGSDGKGADTLLVTQGGCRPEADAHKPRGRKRWPSDLYMDGASLISFALAAIPGLIDQILKRANCSFENVDRFLMHQATAKMLEMLQERVGVDDQKMPIRMEHVGNTVSCTLPVLIDEMRGDGSLSAHMTNMLVGFGVGWSWAGCIWQDVLGAEYSSD